MQFRICADIQYVEGVLAGITIPEGYSVTMPDLLTTKRTMDFLDEARLTKEPILAALTGSLYRIVGEPFAVPEH